MKHKKAWTVGAALMILALGGVLVSKGRPWATAEGSQPPPRPAEPDAASAAPPRSAAIAPNADSASASALALAVATPADTLSPRARRMRDDWCGYGQTEAFKDELAAEAARDPQEKEYRPPPPSDGDQVLKQASDTVLADWIRTLRARSDVRSQAIADYLAFDAPGARAHLQDLARRSTDPMVTALALKRPCASGCTNVDAAQWSRLDPDNAMAWAAQLDRKSSPELLAYVIDRMQRTPGHDDYYATLAQVLSSLAQTRTPGLRQTAELNLMIGTLAAVPFTSLMPLRKACSARTAPGTPEACDRIAQALWDSPSLMQRGMALSLAGQAVPAGSPRHAAWEQRAMEYDIINEAYMERLERDAETMSQTDPRLRCQTYATQHQVVKEIHAGGEWAWARRAVESSPLSREALAARARTRRDGRSFLEDAAQASRPASQPGP